MARRLRRDRNHSGNRSQIERAGQKSGELILSLRNKKASPNGRGFFVTASLRKKVTSRSAYYSPLAVHGPPAEKLLRMRRQGFPRWRALRPGILRQTIRQAPD